MGTGNYFREVALYDASKRNNQGEVLFSFILEPIEVLRKNNEKKLVIDAYVRKLGISTAKCCHAVLCEEEFFSKPFTKLEVTCEDGPSFVFVRIQGNHWYLIDKEREKSITDDSAHALQMLAQEYEFAFKIKAAVRSVTH